MFDDPGFAESRRMCSLLADQMRRHGPVEPHRLRMDEMEYANLPGVMARREGQWEDLGEELPQSVVPA